MDIVDSHHHLWDIERNVYPWLKEVHHDRGWGDVSPILTNYLPADFYAEAKSAGLNLIKSVHVQANFDPTDPVGETRWLMEVADQDGSHGLPTAIVGFADLSAPDVVATLEAHAAHDRVRGIRQVLNRHRDKRLNRAPHDFLNDKQWQHGFTQLAALGLSFDAQIYYHQAEVLCALARLNPDVPIAVDHALMPAERDPESVAGWRRAVQRLAENQNVSIKVSGFGMVDNNWTVESIRPFVQHCIACFGPARTMFGSNFPVDKLMTSYARIWQSFAVIAQEYSTDERRALFRGTAETFYRI